MWGCACASTGRRVASSCPLARSGAGRPSLGATSRFFTPAMRCRLSGGRNGCCSTKTSRCLWCGAVSRKSTRLLGTASGCGFFAVCCLGGIWGLKTLTRLTRLRHLPPKSTTKFRLAATHSNASPTAKQPSRNRGADTMPIHRWAKRHAAGTCILSITRKCATKIACRTKPSLANTATSTGRKSDIQSYNVSVFNSDHGHQKHCVQKRSSLSIELPKLPKATLSDHQMRRLCSRSSRHYAHSLKQRC